MWAKVDDGWWCHPKVMGLSMQARGLWVTALSYTSHAELDGLVPAPLIEALDRVYGKHEVDASLTELLNAGLWTETSEGWRFHDFDYWQSRPYRSDERMDLTWAEEALLRRDGWSCANCRSGCAALQIDHIVPWSKGGGDELPNFQWLCPVCNNSKSDLDQDDWVRSGAAAEAALGACATGTCGHNDSARIRRLADGAPPIDSPYPLEVA